MVAGTTEAAAHPDVVVQTGQAQAAEQEQMSEQAQNIKSEVKARIEAAMDKAMSRPQIEAAEPQGWADIYASGPYQPGAALVPPAGMQSRPLKPHAVIRVGEWAQIAATLVLNPNSLPQDPNINPTDFLSGFKLPYEIEFVTLNLSHGTAAPELSHKVWGNLEPGYSYYTEVFEFKAKERGCIFETNVCFRILDCYKSSPSYSPFAGFATWVFNYDEPSFLDGLLGVQGTVAQPGFLFNTPIRFMTYE